MTYTFLNYPPENVYKRLTFQGSKFLINDEWKKYEEGSLGNSLNAKTQVLSIEQYDIDTTLKECVSKDTSLTDVSYRSFYKCTSLSSISLPNATSIGSEAFLSCISLSSISLPNATLIDRWAFQNCSSLTSVSLPNATSIGTQAFLSCISLSSIYVNNSTLHSIGNGYGIDNQIVVNDDETNIVVAAPAITQVSNDTAISIGYLAFDRCTSLNSISLPNATSIGWHAFSNCTSLSSVNLPNATSIGEYAFIYCASLSSITLGNTTRVVTLNSTGAFSGLPTDYKVYVPANLYNDYINATNWSRIKEHIAVIS